MEVKWKYRYDSSFDEDFYLTGYDDYERSYYTFICPHCQNVIFYREHMGMDVNDDGSIAVYPDIISEPKLKNYFNVSGDIFTEYSNIFSIKYISFFDAILKMTDVLTIICNEHGAKGNNLKERIIDLHEKSIISAKIKDLADIIIKFSDLEMDNRKKIDNGMFERLLGALDYILIHVYGIDKILKYINNDFNERIKELYIDDSVLFGNKSN